MSNSFVNQQQAGSFNNHLYQQSLSQLYSQGVSCVSPEISEQTMYSGYYAQQIAQEQLAKSTKGKSVFSEIAGDIKTFFLQHRGVIYFIVAALVIDHIFFKDAFRLRLQGMADKIVAKVENKIAA